MYDTSHRQDRRRFIGCRVGSVRVSGCSKGCCGWWGPEGVEENERYNYLHQSPRLEDQVDGVGYGARVCASAGRPKYVCFACRRGFKPAFREGNEYRIERFGNQWEVRPECGRMAEMCRMKGLKLLEGGSAEGRRIEAASYRRYLSDQKGEEAKEESEKMGIMRPELWWRMLQSRCPGCGAPGIAVGDTFRVPAGDDEKAWAAVRTMLDEGEKFSYCVTVDEEEELRLEATRVKDRERGKEDWGMEKRRRLEALGLLRAS